MNMTALQGVTNLILPESGPHPRVAFPLSLLNNERKVKLILLPPFAAADPSAVVDRTPSMNVTAMTDMKKLFESEREEIVLLQWKNEVAASEDSFLLFASKSLK